jgi:hypothetical protein
MREHPLMPCHQATYFLLAYGMSGTVGKELPVVEHQHPVAVSLYLLQIGR